MTDRPVRAVLDASAVVAFCRAESIGLGEIIAEIATEDAAFGLPVACLVAGTVEVTDRDLLNLLVGHPSCVLLADDPELWRDVAAALSRVDRYDIASAATLAGALGAYILTRRPGWYVKLPDGAPIIEV